MTAFLLSLGILGLLMDPLLCPAALGSTDPELLGKWVKEVVEGSAST